MMSFLMVDEVVSLAVTVVLRATALLGGAFVISLLLRRSSGLARHTLWTVTLGASLVLPVLVVAGPKIGVRVPGWAADRSTPAALPTRETSDIVAAAYWTVDGELVPHRDTSEADMAGRVQSDLGARAEGSGAVPWSRGDWVTLLLLTWVGVGALVAAAIGLGLLRAGRVFRNAQPVRDPDWLATLDRARWRLGIRRPVELRLSPSVGTPMAGGFGRPDREPRLVAVTMTRIDT